MHICASFGCVIDLLISILKNTIICNKKKIKLITMRFSTCFNVLVYNAVYLHNAVDLFYFSLDLFVVIYTNAFCFHALSLGY